MKTYKVHSFGCKTSQSDALGYAGILREAGWREACEEERPGLLLVQTCTVTMSADAQARQLVRKLKRENANAKILMTGCFAQRIEAVVGALPEVDYVIGNLNPRKYEILSQIAGAPVKGSYGDFPFPSESPRTRPYIKIQDGCDARCSYCIIPSVRGKSRSLPLDEVVQRVQYFRDLGYKEMILTGISMGGYGKDLTPRSSLSELMKRIDALRGDFKIRLSSVEPEEIDDNFVEAFTHCSRFQPHLHLPLQSASDQVLKKMRRQYLFRRFASIVDRIVLARPDLNLGTDLLTGFPGESAKAFEETYNYVQEAPFAYCHVFPFSSRPGTAAANYDAVDHSEVTERAARLRALAKKKNVSYRSRFIGKELRALMLQQTEEALTDNYIRVEVSNRIPLADVVSIRIHSVDENTTRGVVVQ
jgi:threonylcarbamoyladenosine tRNA methylthiotransferase MtaB